MRSLSAAQLLNVWEQGLAQTPVQRALALLAAADPEVPLEILERMSIGERDDRLLTLRAWVFGPQLTCVANCPRCAERLELAFLAEDIRAAPAPEREGAGPLQLEMSGYRLSFRPPNSADLATLSLASDPQQAQARLLARCLIAVEHQGRQLAGVAPDELPAELLQALQERIARADPQADVSLALDCPACEHRWEAIFDVPDFFWSEIHAWAQRTLGEVHLLASAYGWREADILALSAARRQAYLEMIRG